jgi:hypothetical protein
MSWRGLRIVPELTIASAVPRNARPDGEYELLGSNNSRGLKPAAILPFV